MAAPRTRSKATPARRLAVELCREVRLRDAYLRELIDARRDQCALSEEEFAYAQVLAFGSVMCRGVLDELIDRSLSKPGDVRANVRDALRISAYERLFLDKPDHAVVDQGVELVRYVEPRAAGLANAVLRKMTSQAIDYPWAQPGTLESESRKMGLPAWLFERFVEELGAEQAASVGQACLKPAPTYLVDDLYTGTQFAADLASQQVASFVDLTGSVLEVGAGRGTKTALLQCRAKRELGRPASIHTLDVHPFKARLLEERMEAMGIDTVTAHAGDARRLDEVDGLPPSFGCIFIDAPCSGTGTLRRHPEIRWRLTPDDVDDMVALQLALLKSAAGRVETGGSIVYATCSLLGQENAQVIEAFLASSEGEGFAVEPVADLFDEFAECITPEGFFTSAPRDGGPDGHFAAVLRKR